jgi:nicotinate-nucleotide adenylyltransferase
MKIGLYGGSFDPFHLGHLIGAQDALDQCRLSQVIFIPAAQSPHKLNRRTAPAAHRCKMLKAAVRDYPQFSVDTCEVQRGSPSYTIDTVQYFRALHPRAKFFWLIGADQLLHLDTWAQYDALRRLITFIVLDRPGTEDRPSLPGLIYLPRPRLVAISSTEIRERLKKKMTIQHLVPAAVSRHLQRHPLYL